MFLWRNVANYPFYPFLSGALMMIIDECKTSCICELGRIRLHVHIAACLFTVLSVTSVKFVHLC